jgi:hypothetical protein
MGAKCEKNAYMRHFCLKFLLFSKKNNLHLYQKPLTLKNLIVMKTLVDQINAQVAAFQANAAAQVEKNNKAAGTRARKAALELSKLLKEFRKVSVEEAKK